MLTAYMSIIIFGCSLCSCQGELIKEHVIMAYKPEFASVSL